MGQQQWSGLKHPGALGGEGAGRGVSWGGQNYQPRPPPQAEVRVISRGLGGLLRVPWTARRSNQLIKGNQP